MIERSPRAPVLRSMALRGNGAQGRVRPPQDRGFRLLVTGNGIKLSMLPTVRHEDSATSTRKKNNPRKELETRVLFAEVVNFIQTRSREHLRSRRPRAPFRGAGLPSRPTSPASAGFFCGGVSPHFPLGFPSFISDSGLWPTNLAPRVVRMIDAN
jgi:hypothetical protein